MIQQPLVNPQYAGYLDINHPEHIEETLRNAAGGRDIRLIVANLMPKKTLNWRLKAWWIFQLES